LAIQGCFDLVGIDGVTDNYRIATFPPGGIGVLKDIPFAGICWDFQIRRIRNGIS
jgi:hypothetical protein